MQVPLREIADSYGNSDGSDDKEPPAVRETPRFDPWVRKIPGRRRVNPLHYSCLENSIPGGIQSVGSGGVGHE